MRGQFYIPEFTFKVNDTVKSSYCSILIFYIIMISYFFTKAYISRLLPV